MSFTYQTITSAVTEIIYKEKGSKFIGFVVPISNVEDFKTELEKIKTAHPKATHHCYAYRLGISGAQYRANDDGEPSGSAGLPIYNQLLAHELSDVLVVVVRYYGGTKLGVAGLIKAYKETAKQALAYVKTVITVMQSQIQLSFPYALQHQIFNVLNKAEAKILTFETEKNCNITAVIATDQIKSISEKLSEMPEVRFSVF